jgi:mRNA interferase RelE/StbE
MKLLITKKAAKTLDKIPESLARQIIKKLQSLSTDPFPPSSQKLTGQDNYRLRIGVYRAIYTIDTKSKTITILRLAHRKEVYC